MAVGVGVGLIMGLWSFGGPMAVPEWLGDYDDVSRRMARLGHIAFIGLGILNVLMARESSGGGPQLRRIALICMNFGNIALPITLWAAAVYHPLKYLMPVPAMSVLVALSLTAYGIRARSSPEAQR